MTTHAGYRVPPCGSVRTYMANHALDALIIPHDDEHLGEYTPAEAECLNWPPVSLALAGVVILLADSAALFADGRYTVQARLQAPAELFQILHLVEQPHMEWLQGQLQRRQRAGFDPRLHSLAWYQKKSLAAQKEVELIALEENPVDSGVSVRPPARLR